MSFYAGTPLDTGGNPNHVTLGQELRYCYGQVDARHTVTPRQLVFIAGSLVLFLDTAWVRYTRRLFNNNSFPM